MYNSRADAAQWAITSGDDIAEEENDFERGSEVMPGQIMEITVRQGGRRSDNMSVDPPIHYPHMPLINEEMMKEAYIVVPRPEPTVPLQPAQP